MQHIIILGAHDPSKMVREYNSTRDLSDPVQLLKDIVEWADELGISHVSVENARNYLNNQQHVRHS